MILLIPVATVVMISAVVAPAGTDRVIAAVPVEPAPAACARDACRDPPVMTPLAHPPR